MTGQVHSHGWAWEGTGPLIGEPGTANPNEFFDTEGLYYRRKYSSVSSNVRVAGLRLFPQVKKPDVDVAWLHLGWCGYLVCGCEVG